MTCTVIDFRTWLSEHHHMTDTQRCRAEALRMGMYRRSAGMWIPLRELHDAHLINALLRSLEAGEGPELNAPLSAEVLRRGLEQAALAEVARRQGQAPA